jgi:hypothetical protein
MSVQKPRSQGKGDGRRDNLKAFSENLKRVKKNHATEARVFVKKGGRTVYVYNDKPLFG